MKTIIPIFKASIKNCQLIFEDRDKYNNWIAQLNEENDLEVIVRKRKKTRSEKQNRYYWGVILKLISEATGEDAEDLHNHFAYKWLINKGKSGRLHSRKSTSQITTIEFKEYLDKIISWGEQYLGITFPEPENVDLDFVIF